LLEISGSHSNIISDSYIIHYGNELVSRTGNKEIRHFVTTNYDQKYPFAVFKCAILLGVYFDTKLSFVHHVDFLIRTCSHRFYLLQQMRKQGLTDDCLQAIFNSIKKWTTKLMVVTLSNLNRFSKLFHC